MINLYFMKWIIFSSLQIVIFSLFIVSCNKAPTSTIISPEDGAEIIQSDTVIISVDADDKDGSVLEVRFFIDDVGVSSSCCFPYSYLWYTAEETIGNHTIQVMVKDNDGGSTLDEIVVSLKKQEEPNINENQIVDIDGNIYNTVIIGNQCWMQENLKVTHYSDGVVIPNVIDNCSWSTLGNNDNDDAYCYYDNSVENATIYGALYTWAAAMGDNAESSYNNPSGVLGVCPTGWHLPSDDEWKQLEMHLGLSQSEADQEGFRGTGIGSQFAGNSSL